VLALLLALAGANRVFAFTVTFPDSPVVITELPPTIVDSDRGLARTLVRDSRSNLYVVYTVTQEIKIARSTNNGATWNVFATPGRRIDSDDRLHSPCIAIDGGDTIYVAWERDYTDSLIGGVEAIYWSKYNGKTWTQQETLTQDLKLPPANFPMSPSLAIDYNNQAHAAWGGGDLLFVYGTIVYTYLQPSGVWHWPVDSVGDPGGPWLFCLVANLIADRAGNLHLGYQYNYGLIYAFARYRKRWANGIWGPIEDLSLCPWDSTYSGPSVTIIPGDTIPQAIFIEDSNNNSPNRRLYYRFKPDSIWSPAIEIVPFRFHRWYPWKAVLSADRQGHLYAVWSYFMESGSGQGAGRNIWMNQSETPPWWQGAFKVTSDTIIQGVYPSKYNDYPGLGYPVTENGVDIIWMRTVVDSTGSIRYYLMYYRVPSLLGVEQEKEKSPPVGPELTLTPRPNPARGTMEITYGIQASSKQEMVNLTIYNLVGERVRTLVHGPTPGGVYRARWNGKDERLKEAPSGTYFFQLTVGNKQVIKKGTFIR
jgi:hypothetical protein